MATGEEPRSRTTLAVVPATLRQTTVLAILLTVGTVFILFLCNFVFQRLELATTGAVGVPWANPGKLHLRSGPASFWYDQNNATLRHRGPGSEEIKQSLLGLIEGEDSGYREAIDALAFKSHNISESAFRW